MPDAEKCFEYRILTKQPATAEDLSLPEQVRTEVSTAVRAVACQQHFLRPGTMSGGSIGAAVRQTVGAAFTLDLEAMPKPVVTKLQTSLHNILAEPNKSSFTIPVSDALNYIGVTKLSDDLWLEVIFMPTGQKSVSAGWKKSLQAGLVVTVTRPFDTGSADSCQIRCNCTHHETEAVAMKLEMYPVVVDTTEAEDVAISVPGGTGSVRVTVEQVPFLIDLLSKAKTQIEDDRYRRANS